MSLLQCGLDTTRPCRIPLQSDSTLAGSHATDQVVGEGNLCRVELEGCQVMAVSYHSNWSLPFHYFLFSKSEHKTHSAAASSFRIYRVDSWATTRPLHLISTRSVVDLHVMATEWEIILVQAWNKACAIDEEQYSICIRGLCPVLYISAVEVHYLLTSIGTQHWLHKYSTIQHFYTNIRPATSVVLILTTCYSNCLV